MSQFNLSLTNIVERLQHIVADSDEEIIVIICNKGLDIEIPPDEIIPPAPTHIVPNPTRTPTYTSPTLANRRTNLHQEPSSPIASPPLASPTPSPSPSPPSSPNLKDSRPVSLFIGLDGKKSRNIVFCKHKHSDNNRVLKMKLPADKFPLRVLDLVRQIQQAQMDDALLRINGKQFSWDRMSLYRWTGLGKVDVEKKDVVLCGDDALSPDDTVILDNGYEKNIYLVIHLDSDPGVEEGVSVGK
jgi:hypothetical protein